MSEANRIDWEHFEYVIALNVTTNETYAAAIIDALDLSFIKGKEPREYIKIVLDFYRKRGVLPNPGEIVSYLSTPELKEAYKTVVIRFKTLGEKFNFDELISNTEQYFRERAVYNAVFETVNKTSKENGVVNTDETFKLFEKACNISLIDDLGHDYFYEIDEHIKQLGEVDTYISSGWKWLDKQLGGGFLKTGRAFYLFTGATNSGKSIVLGNVAANMTSQGLCVPIISLEMPQTIYAKRVSSQLSRIPIGDLKRESDVLKKYLEEFKSEHPQARLFIKEYPPKSISANHIKAYLQKIIMRERVKIDAVVIDYINLLKPASITQGGMYENIKTVAEEVRALSYIF